MNPGATGRVLWALVDTRLQQWNMSIEGWEELLLEEDLDVQIRDAIRSQFPNAPREDAELDLELLDLKVQGSVQQYDLCAIAFTDSRSDRTT